MNWGHYLFGFSGRINRAKYWLWVLLYLIAAIVIGVVVYAINSAVVGGIINIAFGIAGFISTLAILSKRLHDRNRSAWWILIFYVLPSVLIVIGVVIIFAGAMSGGSVDANNLRGPGLVGGVCFLVAAVVVIWAFVEVACLRGTVGPNQYGADPLEGHL
jgi:uncharacterized membrane protein YhaH (DUF805 family)